jgi:glutamine synthetase
VGSEGGVKVLDEIERRGLKQLRFSFADQHGVLRGKTLAAAQAKEALERGVTVTSTLLLKDTAHRTV